MLLGNQEEEDYEDYESMGGIFQPDRKCQKSRYDHGKRSSKSSGCPDGNL